MERYLELWQIGLHDLDCSRVPPVRLKAYEISSLDDALDVLDLLIAGIAGKAKTLGTRKRMRTLKDLDKAALVIANDYTMLLNDDINSQDLRATVFANYPKDQLARSIADRTELLATPAQIAPIDAWLKAQDRLAK